MGLKNNNPLEINFITIEQNKKIKDFYDHL